MSTSESNEARAKLVKITAHDLIVSLEDGRRLQVPLAWFPRLCKATSVQRRHYRLIGSGIGIHWPRIDEDISIAGLLNMSAHPLVFQNYDLTHRSSPLSVIKEPRVKYGKKK